MNAHKRVKDEAPAKASGAMIVEGVIEKVSVKTQEVLPEGGEQQLSAIELRIQEQKRKVNPFKKSAVVSTTFEVRQSKRNRKRAREDRDEKKKKQGKAE